MPPIMKAYTASLMALNHYPALDENSPGATFYGHRSSICLAPFLDAAARLARESLFEVYPESDGWSNHDAVITPITEEFFAGLQQYIDQGLFTGESDKTESMKEFHFGHDPTRVVLDDDASGQEN